ncbi:MAG: GNAT family N-acetyltransferase [bacterium]|nr:GNAT family N-acetyltransferase [bacterium]
MELQCGKRFVMTDGDNEDFSYLCSRLDENLDELVGTKFQRKQYEQFNTREAIHDVILIYDGNRPIGCGSFKHYDQETMEIKRVFVEKEFRGQGLSKELLSRLEEKAKSKGYKYAVLETGKPLVAAMKLYKSIGYKVVPNYGPYKEMPNSICMEKEL